MTRKNIKIVITVALVILMVAMPLASAQAIWVLDIVKCGTILALFDLSGCLQFALMSVTTIVGTLVSGSASALNWVLGVSQALVAPDIVRESWVIFRNFVNMFFILVLIIMAFGTIFNIPDYTFKDLFPRFLTSALLINFSLEIGVYVLRVANGLASVFLTTIGDVGTRLASGLLVAKLVSPGGDLTERAANELQAIASGPGAVVTMLALIIFLIIIFATFLAATLFILARIVVIWFLLIVSPVAWFGYMLPTLKAETWSKWWKTFIGWSFFLPTYLFFIMFAAILLSAKKSVGLTVGGYENTLQAGDYAKAFFQIIPLTDLLFFVLVIMVLLGGISISFKIGGFAAHGAGAVMGGAQNYLKGARIFGGRSISDFQGGLKQLGSRVQKEGLPTKIGKMFYGGSEAAKVREQRVSQGLGSMLGYRSLQEGNKAEQAAAAQEADVILNDPKINLDNLQQKLVDDKGADLTNAFGQINTKKVAEYLALAKKGKLSKKLLDYLTAAIGNRNPEIMKDIGKSLAETSFGGFKDEEVAAVMATSDKSNRSVRKEAQRWMSSEDGRRRMPDILSDPATATAIMNQGMEDLGRTTGEARGFMRIIGEKRADLAAGWKSENEVKSDGSAKTLAESYQEVLQGKSESDMIGMSKTTWANKNFQDALLSKLDELQQKLPTGAEGDVWRTGGGLDFIQGLKSASRGASDAKEKLEALNAMLGQEGKEMDIAGNRVRSFGAAMKAATDAAKDWRTERQIEADTKRDEARRGRREGGGGIVDEHGRPLRS